MFILPLLIIVGLTNLYFFNKKISYFLTMITSIFFLIENTSLNPYQYTWLNSFAKFIDYVVLTFVAFSTQLKSFWTFFLMSLLHLELRG